MPVLPIIDLLIFAGWTTLAAGGVLKTVHVATSYRPTLAGLAPVDLLLVALCFLLLALTLSARSIVRQNEARAQGRSPRRDDYPRPASAEGLLRSDEVRGEDVRFAEERTNPPRAADAGRS